MMVTPSAIPVGSASGRIGMTLDFLDGAGGRACCRAACSSRML